MNLAIPSEIVVGIVVAIALMLLGEYIGYKIGRVKLATYGGLTILGVVIIYAIYAIVFALTK
jgi:hypothetical protein